MTDLDTKALDGDQLISSIIKSILIFGLLFLLVFFIYFNNGLSFSQDFSIDGPLASAKGPKLSKYKKLRDIDFNLQTQLLIRPELVKNRIVSNFQNLEPLLTSVSDENAAEDIIPSEEDRAWFYFNPNRDIISLTSLANRQYKVSEDTYNRFAWYKEGKKSLLFQEDVPYSGWYFLPFEGLRYFNQGKATDKHKDLTETALLEIQCKTIRKLLPINNGRSLILVPKGYYSKEIDEIPQDYQILFKSQEEIILSSPPGTRDSYLVSHTENYFDMPMEVIGQVSTEFGDWLHVNIGYEELGWIKKDESLKNYVMTYYSERELLDTIYTIMEEEISGMNARAAASFVNNETMSQVSYNNQIFFPASTQKIYVLGELYRQYASEILYPDNLVTLYDYDKVPGAGVIQGYPAGSQFTLNELVDLVAYYSDNTAANLLIDAVGGGANINPSLHKMGLYDTFLEGKYYHQGTQFTTSPADAARFFAYLANNKVNGEPWDEMLINKFMMNNHTFLRSYLYGSGSYSWNKSGLGGTEQNDVATFVTPYGSYSIAVYTANPMYYGAIGEQIAYLSLRVHNAFNELQSQLWIGYEE